MVRVPDTATGGNLLGGGYFTTQQATSATIHEHCQLATTLDGENSDWVRFEPTDQSKALLHIGRLSF
jgi:hypothetical protein